MRLSPADVARILNVAESAVFRWADHDEIPHARVGDRYWFNRTELIEWATGRGMDFSPDLIQTVSPDGEGPLSLYAALDAGGVFTDLAGADREEVLRTVVETMHLPSSVDPGFLYDMLMMRENLGSTALGEGIAIPHARMPVVLRVRTPSVSLSYLRTPIDFGALDAQPVSILFTIVSPNIGAHLKLLAILSFAIHDEVFKASLLAHSPADVMLAQAKRIDSLMLGSAGVRG